MRRIKIPYTVYNIWKIDLREDMFSVVIRSSFDQSSIARKRKFIMTKKQQMCTTMFCKRENIVIEGRLEKTGQYLPYQGWEFAHLISGRVPRFLSKNERMSDSLEKMIDSLIRSFLVSDLSYSLTIAHFL